MSTDTTTKALKRRGRPPGTRKPPSEAQRIALDMRVKAGECG